jgi:RNA polymerase sigma-70 factor (ECF subfamily)
VRPIENQKLFSAFANRKTPTGRAAARPTTRHSQRQRFEERSSLSTWISRIAINECYGYLRKKQPIYESNSADGSLSMHMQNVADPQSRADLGFMQRDFINKLLTQVSEEERLLIIWKEVDGLSLAELSEMTGQRVNTIKVKLFRARQKLFRAAQSRDRGL